MTWQQSVTLAAGLMLAAGVAIALGRSFESSRLRRGRQVGPWLWQAGVVFALYALWQIALDALVTSTTGAVAHGRQVVQVERWLHLPSEAAFQSLLLPHPLVVKVGNLYYAGVDFPALELCLIWLWWRHRDRYRGARLTLVLVTGMAAIIQAVPVAPPRLLPGLGVVDTGMLYHQSVYPSGGLSDPGQLIAMPSVHVAWAAFVAMVVITASRSAWRWLILLHPVLTIAVVVGTGNHYWLDGIVGMALLAVAVTVEVVLRGRTVVAGRTLGPSGPRSGMRGRRGRRGGVRGREGRGTVSGGPGREPAPATGTSRGAGPEGSR